MTVRFVRVDAVQPGERMAVVKSLRYHLVTSSEPAPRHRRRLTLEISEGESRDVTLAENRMVWVRDDTENN